MFTTVEKMVADFLADVGRVINEQITTPIIDGAYSSDLGQYAVVFSNPTVVAGADIPSGKIKTATVSFKGARFGTNNKIVAQGTISLYGICGQRANPANLSPAGSYALWEGGSAYQFSKGGAIDTAVSYTDS